MKRFVILYDANCKFCIKCKDWLSNQEQYIELYFVPKDADNAQRHYGHLIDQADCDQLILIAAGGRVYIDDRALIMCLYALKDYRELSAALSNPAMLPLTKQFFHTISENRDTLSQFV